MNAQKKAKVIAALKELKTANPWKGTRNQRIEKFEKLNSKLCTIFGRRVSVNYDELGESPDNWSGSGRTSYLVDSQTIVPRGRLSVITFLHKWLNIVNVDEELEEIDTLELAAELFKTVFPDKFAKLRQTSNGA